MERGESRNINIIPFSSHYRKWIPLSAQPWTWPRSDPVIVTLLNIPSSLTSRERAREREIEIEEKEREKKRSS